MFRMIRKQYLVPVAHHKISLNVLNRTGGIRHTLTHAGKSPSRSCHFVNYPSRSK